MAEYYPPVSFHFRVEFGLPGLVPSRDAHFQSVSGLEVQVTSETYREAGENRFQHELPTGTTYGNLVLKRGFFKDSALIDWVNKALQTLIFEPIDLSVFLLNEQHEPLASWNVVGAWPKEWSFSDLDAEKSELFIETLQLQYRYFMVRF